MKRGKVQNNVVRDDHMSFPMKPTIDHDKTACTKSKGKLVGEKGEKDSSKKISAGFKKKRIRRKGDTRKASQKRK